MNYDVNYFIQKFEAIPEELWCVRTRSNGYQRCALGWCYPTHEEAKASEFPSYGDSAEDKYLCATIRILNPEYGAGGINNGQYPRYQQPTPKQRILAALYDIKKLQEWEQEPKPSYHDITKQLAILPIEETTDKINTKILQS